MRLSLSCKVASELSIRENFQCWLESRTTQGVQSACSATSLPWLGHGLPSDSELAQHCTMSRSMPLCPHLIFSEMTLPCCSYASLLTHRQERQAPGRRCTKTGTWKPEKEAFEGREQRKNGGQVGGLRWEPFPSASAFFPHPQATTNTHTDPELFQVFLALTNHTAQQFSGTTSFNPISLKRKTEGQRREVVKPLGSHRVS